jgi:hypothetical protein
MALFDFLKRGKKQKEEKPGGVEPSELRPEELRRAKAVSPPSKPKIKDIPSFPFEKEELLPPIKPIEPDMKPLEKKPAPPPKAPPRKGFKRFIPKTIHPEGIKPVVRKEEVVVERPIFREKIRPEPVAVKPAPSAFVQPKALGKEEERKVPYIRVYKFRGTVQDLNQVAKSLKLIPTKLRTKSVEEAYERFENSLDTIMKRIDAIEGSMFE